jgi:hypothetical protein
LETRMNQQQMLQDQSSFKQSNQQAQIGCRTSGLISTFGKLRKLFKKLRLPQWIKHPAVVSHGITEGTWSFLVAHPGHWTEEAAEQLAQGSSSLCPSASQRGTSLCQPSSPGRIFFPISGIQYYLVDLNSHTDIIYIMEYPQKSLEIGILKLDLLGY